MYAIGELMQNTIRYCRHYCNLCSIIWTSVVGLLYGRDFKETQNWCTFILLIKLLNWIDYDTARRLQELETVTRFIASGAGGVGKSPAFGKGKDGICIACKQLGDLIGLFSSTRSFLFEMSDHGCIHLNNFKAAKGIQPYRIIHAYFVACTTAEARSRKVCVDQEPDHLTLITDSRAV
jgi:hypothetical protein